MPSVSLNLFNAMEYSRLFDAAHRAEQQRENGLVRAALGKWVSEAEPVLLYQWRPATGRSEFVGIGADGTGVIVRAHERLSLSQWYEDALGGPLQPRRWLFINPEMKPAPTP